VIVADRSSRLLCCLRQPLGRRCGRLTASHSVARPRLAVPSWFKLNDQRMRNRLCAIVVAAAIGGACASAPRTRSFQELPKYLEVEKRIELTVATGTTTMGTLLVLSPTSLTMMMAGDRRYIPQDQVARIRRPERWIGRGALIGLGVGSGLGWIGARSQEPTGTFIDAQAAGVNFLGGMIVGTAAGALSGAFAKVNRTVYEPPALQESSARTK
jgi:hypothetical protein